MYNANRNMNQLNRNLVIVFIFILIIGAVFVGIKIGTPATPSTSVQPQSPAPSAGQTAEQLDWKAYENKQYNVSFKYPPSWSVIPSTQAFENGDLVTVQFIGKTQQQNTELYDGARFVVMIPQPTNLDLNSWVNTKHGTTVSGTPPQISDMEINGVPFKKVYECGLGCFTYYYTVTGRQVYGISVFADGPQKVELEATIDQILKTTVLPK